jgi:hypothetical protein
MSGEALRAYRSRLLRRFKHHSKEFADADLGAIMIRKSLTESKRRIALLTGSCAA